MTGDPDGTMQKERRKEIVMKKLGLIVDHKLELLERGGLDASPLLRAAVGTLQHIEPLKDGGVSLLTGGGDASQAAYRELGLSPKVVGTSASGVNPAEAVRVTAADMLAEGVDLLLFIGGDATARDILDVVGGETPVLGVAVDSNSRSTVFAKSPRAAAEVASLLFQDKLMKYRQGEVIAVNADAPAGQPLKPELLGYLMVPEVRPHIRCGTACAVETIEETVERLIDGVIHTMDEEPDTVFIVGPGLTTHEIMRRLNLPDTLLGLDIVKGRQIVLNAAGEDQILEIIRGRHAKLVISPIGPDGHLFGLAGRRVLTPRVIREVGREHIIIASTRGRIQLMCGRPFVIDTGDSDLDVELSGYMRVTVGPLECVLYRVSSQIPIRMG